MHRSNPILSPPPPPPHLAILGHLTILCAWGVGNWTGKTFPGPRVGNLTFIWVGWAKLNFKCQLWVSENFLFFLVFFFSGAEVGNYDK